MTTTASTTSTGGGGGLSRSASAIVAVTESGQHLLRIDGYSHTMDVPTGSDIKSPPFRVGGHSWRICYYPNGLSSAWTEYISLFLQLDGDVPQGVWTRHTFSLLGREGKPVPYFTNTGKKIFTDWGTSAFIRRSELERSEHLRDDSFTIRCDVTVKKEIQTKSVNVSAGAAPKVVPPPDLHRHLGRLLATGEAADVAFEVDGKTFMAHRCVLMARSPVLRAQLSALPAAADGSTIAVRIEDMEAQDFEALLRYMYTDSLPEMGEQGEAAAMLPDLVAAANRYGMERLRLLCEDRLRGLVDARTVAVILAFAAEHHCHGLKEACLRFLGDPENLREVVKTNGLEHLSKSCPSVLVDLVAKLAAE
ncbi:BTB/POZ and MATH domain-containing protein 1-like [Panicum miliaceum]|uniref:BTB/POZ and MATH domain-containing protein 1-like n=1 Tax=Panicum miliaceum TaxID=4540 RepID=A0A3L6TS71_PANMI|nr:BTB/POZ and MATH domain-containing protein 1-like [Panicum miliaceum]